MQKFNLKELSDIFNSRHDFNSSELNTLYSKFDQIKFENIPEAWIILIDELLSKVGDNIICVSQKFSYLCINIKNGLDDNKKDLTLNTVKYFENKLYEIDADIHTNSLKEIYVN